MERVSIKLPRYDLHEYARSLKLAELGYDGLRLINVRGSNGSGKSSIPLQMLATDRKAFLLTMGGKDVVTVFPTYDFMAMGRYRTKTGGLDGYSGNAQTKEVLDAIWELPFSILMEGVISSTIFSTYADLFKELETRTMPSRKIGVMNLLPPLELIEKRIQKRNGGKEIKFDQVESKWRTVKKNAEKFKEAGLISWEADNSGIELGETVDWFFKEINEHVK